MPRHPLRRRSQSARVVRSLLSLVALAALGVTVYAGVMVARSELTDRSTQTASSFRSESPNTIPIDAASIVREAPLSITISDIQLWGPIRAVGIEDDGLLEVPDETEVGWYQYGSAPGLPGVTVLAAHVSWNRTYGPFYRLRELEPGAVVDVHLADNTVRRYEVIERTIYHKDELPKERVWRTTGEESLVLITCGGSYNPDIRRYRENIVVYAVPVDTVAPGTPVPTTSTTPPSKA